MTVNNDITIIAFLDVLGYRSLIENNELDEVAKLIDSTFLEIPPMLGKKFEGICPPSTNSKLWNTSIPGHIIVSDSILIYSQFITITNDDLTSGLFNSDKLFLFFLYLEYVSFFMLHAGLPVRGGIDMGQIYINQSTFVGKPIVRAYEIAEELDFAGIVFHPENKENFEVLEEMCGENNAWNIRDFFFNARYPLKSGNTRQGLVFNYYCNREVKYEWQPRYSQFPIFKQNVKLCRQLLECFGAFNKKCNKSVIRKVENTAKLWKKGIKHKSERKNLS